MLQSFHYQVAQLTLQNIKIAPQWYGILEQDTIIDRQGSLSISGGDRCFVGEIYLLGKASYSKCQPCRTFSYIFYYLIEKIPYRIGVYKWSTPIEKWETDFRYTVKKAVEGGSIERDIGAMLTTMLDYYKQNIEVYRDLFNCFANNYLQHLSQCETYVENVAIATR